MRMSNKERHKFAFAISLFEKNPAEKCFTTLIIPRSGRKIIQPPSAGEGLSRNFDQPECRKAIVTLK